MCGGIAPAISAALAGGDLEGACFAPKEYLNKPWLQLVLEGARFDDWPSFTSVCGSGQFATFSFDEFPAEGIF